MILWTLVATTAVAAPTLDAPASAGVGSTVDVQVAGSTNARDFVTIVPKGTREGAYADYQYVEKRAVLKLKAPVKPGEYEVRLLGTRPTPRSRAGRSASTR
jgi:Ca-activated chloride channel family protein